MRNRESHFCLLLGTIPEDTEVGDGLDQNTFRSNNYPQSRSESPSGSDRKCSDGFPPRKRAKGPKAKNPYSDEDSDYQKHPDRPYE